MTTATTDETTEVTVPSSSEEATASRTGTVVNFRPAAGLKHLYRSGNPDYIVNAMDIDPKLLDEAERMLLFDATLIIDLRMDAERREENLQAFYKNAPGGAFTIVSGAETAPREVRRYDPLAKTIQGFAKLGQEGNESEKAEFDAAVKADGLAFFLKMFLENHKEDFVGVLKSITEHLERQPRGEIVFYCSQGKDRTGVVALLLQSIMGVEDELILADFEESKHHMRHAPALHEDAEKAKRMGVSGLFDLKVLRSAEPELLEKTMRSVREKYGSINPGYLDAAGFDESWRARFAATQA